MDEVSLREREAKRAIRKGTNVKAQRRQDAKKKQGSRTVVSYGFGAGSGFGAPAEEPKPDIAAEAAEQAAREAELLRIKEAKDAAKAALKQAQRKSEPEVVAFARDLRDRWQECVAPGSDLAGMLAGKARGKYEVSRMIDASPPAQAPEIISEAQAVPKRLDAA